MASDKVHWFLSNGFSSIQRDGEYYLIRNKLVMPVEMADSLNEERHFWRLLWAADNGLSIALNEKQEMCFGIDSFWMDFNFTLNAPMDAVEKIYFQNPELKVH